MTSRRERLLRAAGSLPGVVAAARVVRDPRRQLRILRDWIGFARATRPLRRKPSDRDGQVLLVISLTEWVYQLKIEGLLSWALRDKGWRVVVLTTSNRTPTARRIYRCFGITEFVCLEDFALSDSEREECAADAMAFDRPGLTFQAVKQWRYRGALIGPQILSTISRSRRAGAPDVSDPAVRQQVLAALPAALERVRQGQAIVEAVRPSLGLVMEANYLTYGPFVDAAVSREIPVIQVVQPWKDDSLIFKRLTKTTRRVHAASVELSTLASVARRGWSDAQEQSLNELFADRYGGKWVLQNRNQPGTRPMGREEIIRQLGLDRDRPLAAVFSHILWDANLFYGEDLFDDYADWFAQTVRAAVANPRVNWLIKLHPANLWKRARERCTDEYFETELLRAAVGELPSHVVLLYPDVEISTLSLFQAVDFGITVRGTAGMELPCFGVPTITAGTGRYAGLGFTVDPRTTAEYLALLGALPHGVSITPEQVTLAKQHALTAFSYRQWRLQSFRCTFNKDFSGSDPLDHNIAPTFTSLGEVHRNGDLRRFAEWAALSTDPDYLEFELAVPPDLHAAVPMMQAEEAGAAP